LKVRHIPTAPDRKRRHIKTLLLVLLLLILLAVAAAGALFLYFSSNLPKLMTLDDYRPSLPTVMYDKDGAEAARFYIENREIISIDQVPRQVINAVLAIEDAHYYEHKGLDYLAIFRAFLKNMVAGEVRQGGSTITQQVAKSLLLSNERTYSRKFKEAILARRIDGSFSKDEILEIYLNQSYFGHGSYGVESAAQNYFQKHVWELSLPESALLAGLPKAPSTYDPTRNPEKALERRNLVLQRMFEENFITRQEMEEAAATPLNLDPKEKDPNDPAAWFAEEVRRYLYASYGEEALYSGGMKVFTTMDSTLQGLAGESLRGGLEDLDKRQGFRGPVQSVPKENFAQAIETLWEENGLSEISTETEGVFPLLEGQRAKALVTAAGKDFAELDLGGVQGILPVSEMTWARPPDFTVDYSAHAIKRADEALRPGMIIHVRYMGKTDKGGTHLFALEQEPLVEGAFVCLDAATGRVLALVGGYDYNRSEFNRATQAQRQPGSAFKPIVYSAAMDNGFTPSSIIMDSPIIYDNPSQELKWKPSNYSERFYGPTTLRTGLIQSRNVITIKLVQKLGIQTVIQYARRFGIKQELPPDLSIALGSMGLSPMDLTAAFTVFPNLGLRASPWFITRVEDRDGNILEEGGPELVRALSEDTAYIMQSLLRGVVQSGTGWRARELERPCGGKTGTTNDMIDAWYLGFTPDIVAGVWVGFDEESTLGQNETGSRASSPIWVNFMKKALAGRPVLAFPPPPPGIEMVKIDPETGLLADSGADRFIYEAYKVGTAPKEFAGDGDTPGDQYGGGGRSPGYMPRSGAPGIIPRDY